MPDEVEGVSLGYSGKQRRSAEVAVGDPDVICRYQPEYLRRQRPLLRVPIFAWDHVRRQHQFRIKYDQRVSWQRTRDAPA